MSFYGSTYFQLIDTFYKILVKNKGGVTVSDPVIDNWASQASGRKGILEFGTGNRWIYAVQDVNNPNSYIFQHARAGGENLTKQEFAGGLKSIPSGETYTILTPGSFIKAPQFEYDEAGHIAISNDVYYQMPISETEQAIEDLQNKVGVPAEEASDGTSTGLFAAVDEINGHLNGVEDKIDQTQGELGDYRDLFPTTYWDTDNNFFGAFGDMEDLRQEFFDDKSSSKTLAEGIITFKQYAEKMIAGNLELLQGQQKLINVNTNDIKTLNTEVEALQAKDKAIDVIAESLQAQITANKSACDSNLAAEIARAKEEESRIEGLITAEVKRAADEEGRIEGLITAEVKRATDEEDRIEGLINNNTNSISNLTTTVNDNKSAAESVATGLSNRITALETNSATSEALNAVNAIVGQNTEAIAALGGSITQLDEKSSAAIDAVDDRIDLLNNTVTTQGNTLSNKADSSTVTTLETKVDNNKSAVDNALATKVEQSAFEVLQTAVSNKAEASTVAELTNLVSAKANQTELNTLSELVNTKASQESLNDLAAAVNGAARADAFEKYVAITDAKIAEMSAKIEELTARIEALENPTPPDNGGVEGE